MKLTLAVLLTLAACQTIIPEPEAKAPNQCGASGYANLIGQPSSVFASMTFPAPMRIIKDGMAVTLDYLPNRLNFDLDKSEKIQRVWCG